MSNFLEEIIEKDLEEKKVDKIITRFPPEPNGYLHIGHAKAIYINYFMVAKKYNGICNLRFDDTNPEKEDEEFVQAIIEDLKWLGFKGDVFYASDYFDKIYEYAIMLIKKGLAYVDESSAIEIKQMRGTLVEKGKESKFRNSPIEQSLQKFEKMKQGKVDEDVMVLRAKIDMASSNINLRDPIIYRVCKKFHHRQKNKWVIFPTYDFAHPLEDAIENVSHSFCSLEFENHRPLYDWIIDNCEIKNKPHQYEFARLNLNHTLLSKRFLKKLIDDKIVDGWDDPAMPTISGLRRRGYTPKSIISFCEKLGVSKANSEADISMLESCIRDELNESAERVMVVVEPLEVEITNLKDDFCEEIISKNNQKLTFSNKIFIEQNDFALVPPPKYKRLTINGVVRLMDAYIIKCIDAKVENGQVKKIYAEVVDNSKSGQDCTIKAKGVIHWVDAKNSIQFVVKRFSYLLDDFGNNNREIIKKYNAVSAPFLENKFDNLQFVRQGYFIRDKKIMQQIVFNETVSLKDKFNK